MSVRNEKVQKLISSSKNSGVQTNKSLNPTASAGGENQRAIQVK
jgi:hypothetical protein